MGSTYSVRVGVETDGVGKLENGLDWERLLCPTKKTRLHPKDSEAALKREIGIRSMY